MAKCHFMASKMTSTSLWNFAKAFFYPNGTQVTKLFAMDNEHGLVDVSTVHFDLPVSRGGIKSREHFCLAERVDALIHSENRISFSLRDSIQTTVFDSKPKTFVLLEHENSK